MQSKRKGEQCVTVTLPELLQLSHTARELKFSSLKLRNPHSGQHLSRLMGRGMEFAESRRYQSGDDIRTIDWRVTARTGKAHSKMFKVEKERQILICVDMRSTMFFATRGVFKSVQASLVAGHAAWSCIQGGNRLGGVIFTDSCSHEFRPALGKRGVLPFLQQLAESAAYPAQKKQNLSTASLEDAVIRIDQVAAPGSLIFIVSDFRHLTERARDLLIQLTKSCDLNLCFVYDRFEESLPKNGRYAVGNELGEMQINTFDKKTLEQYHKQFAERRANVRSLTQHRHVHYMECTTEEDIFKKFTQ